MTIDLAQHVEYPESDGEPMAETDMHRAEMLALIDTLEERFRDRDDVQVSGNNFIYYEEGQPSAVFSPDVYVVIGVEKRRRRVYKLWEERVAPCFVMELSSRGTWLEDVGNKKALCARLGVAEYFLYDPEADVVKPPLQGYRLHGSGQQAEYRRIEPRDDGALESEQLGFRLWLDDALQLHCMDLRTGVPLLRSHEARQAQRDAESRAHDAETRARDAESRAQAAERELARLRKP